MLIRGEYGSFVSCCSVLYVARGTGLTWLSALPGTPAPRPRSGLFPGFHAPSSLAYTAPQRSLLGEDLALGFLQETKAVALERPPCPP